jgi:hypothetical protein
LDKPSQPKTVFIYVLKENQFIGMHPLIEEDTIQSKLFPELDFTLESILKKRHPFKIMKLKGFVFLTNYI